LERGVREMEMENRERGPGRRARAERARAPRARRARYFFPTLSSTSLSSLTRVAVALRHCSLTRPMTEADDEAGEAPAAADRGRERERGVVAPALGDFPGDAHSGRRRGVVEVEGGGGEPPLTPSPGRGVVASASGGRGGREEDGAPGAASGWGGGNGIGVRVPPSQTPCWLIGVGEAPRRSERA
jgi:hypothetical protein